MLFQSWYNVYLELLDRVHNFGEIIAFLALEDLPAADWAGLATSLILRWIQGVNDQRDEGVQSIIAAWSQSEAVHSRSNLLLFFACRPALVLFSSPWSLRPLGKAFPDVDTVCDCQPRTSRDTGRSWRVAHTALPGMPAPDVQVNLTCSRCRSTWHVSNNLSSGTLREANGRFTVEHVLNY